MQEHGAADNKMMPCPSTIDDQNSNRIDVHIFTPHKDVDQYSIDLRYESVQ